jgi:hypothetical protein
MPQFARIKSKNIANSEYDEWESLIHLRIF